MVLLSIFPARRHHAANPDSPLVSATAPTEGDGAPLVKLLKDGLKDGRVEAQEYALWSLSSITDSASKDAVVQAGGIPPLIKALQSGRLSATAEDPPPWEVRSLCTANVRQPSYRWQDAQRGDEIYALGEPQ